MSAAKFTPLQVLQHQKARLQAKSDALLEVVEDDLAYVQHHFGSMLGRTITEVVASKVPPIIRSLLGREEPPDDDVYYRALIAGVLDMLPFLIKGRGGCYVRWIADLIRIGIVIKT
jgi:hypothetical protein